MINWLNQEIFLKHKILNCHWKSSFCKLNFDMFLIDVHVLYEPNKCTNARQLSLYWEGDLRKPSYFLNKRKELEFFIWNLVDLQYLASYVRGKVTKTIELQGKSPKYQQEYAENDFQIEKKSLFTHFRCYCQDDTFMEKFY